MYEMLDLIYSIPINQHAIYLKSQSVIYFFISTNVKVIIVCTYMIVQQRLSDDDNQEEEERVNNRGRRQQGAAAAFTRPIITRDENYVPPYTSCAWYECDVPRVRSESSRISDFLAKFLNWENIALYREQQRVVEEEEGVRRRRRG